LNIAEPHLPASADQRCSAGDIITKKRNRLLEESTSTLLLLKHWLKQTDLQPWEKWGYELEDAAADPSARHPEGIAGDGAGPEINSDHDAPEGADSAAEAALNSSSGLSDISD
jgi:hypothetical protein